MYISISCSLVKLRPSVISHIFSEGRRFVLFEVLYCIIVQCRGSVNNLITFEILLSQVQSTQLHAQIKIHACKCSKQNERLTNSRSLHHSFLRSFTSSPLQIHAPRLLEKAK
ncbi:hypothetical protein VTL71DRAFT_11824 [Oculimacula yallundae]|uniref:Uncharacterized protein n=1 Tax=Oculimacula yallundae TaxID=86028 RepID=A0ABR4CTK4_9HELO